MSFVYFFVVGTPSLDSSQSILIPTILEIVFGVCTLFLLFVVILLLILPYIRKWRRKTPAQAVSDIPMTVNAIYECPDAVLTTNIQASIFQRLDVLTETINAYSTRLKVLEDKDKNTMQNL